MAYRRISTLSCIVFKVNVLYSVFLLTIWANCIYASDFESQMTFPVFHSLSDGSESQFVQRGLIVIHSLKNQDASYKETATLSPTDISKLKKLSQEDKMYLIKVISNSGNEESHSVTSFMRACSLYESQLSDKLTVSLDQTGALLGVSITTASPQCQGITRPDKSNFNTTIELVQTVTGPVPDTQTYISRMEMEKAEKARGEHTDNRSFFAKYWMYIVPLVIFLLISGASQPDGQGGGGGGASR